MQFEFSEVFSENSNLSDIYFNFVYWYNTFSLYYSKYSFIW